MQDFLQSTAAVMPVGPILDIDGEPYLSDDLDAGDFLLYKNGAVGALDEEATVAHVAGDLNGMFAVTLTTSDTDTLGRIDVTPNVAGLAGPKASAMVRSAAWFAACVTGSGVTLSPVTHQAISRNIFGGDLQVVSKAGHDGNAGTTAAPVLTIAQGVTNAGSGDTLLLGDGTWTEDPDISAKNLRVRGAGRQLTNIIGTFALGSVSHFEDLSVNCTSNPLGCWDFGNSGAKSLYLTRCRGTGTADVIRSIVNEDVCYLRAVDCEFDGAYDIIGGGDTQPLVIDLINCRVKVKGDGGANLVCGLAAGALMVIRMWGGSIEAEDGAGTTTGVLAGGGRIELYNGVSIKTSAGAGTVKDIVIWDGGMVITDGTCSFDPEKVTGTITYVEPGASILDDVKGLNGAAMRGTDGANTVAPNNAGITAAAEAAAAAASAAQSANTKLTSERLAKIEGAAQTDTKMTLSDATEAEIDAIKRKADLLGTGSVAFNGPVTPAGHVLLVSGQAYLAEKGTGLSWTISDYAGPSLAGATGKLRFLTRPHYEAGVTAADLEVDAAVTQDGTTVTVTADLAADDCAELETVPPSTEYNYRLQAWAVEAGWLLFDKRATVSMAISGGPS